MTLSLVVNVIKKSSLTLWQNKLECNVPGNFFKLFYYLDVRLRACLWSWAPQGGSTWAGSALTHKC